jgi:hypothetical protein
VPAVFPGAASAQKPVMALVAGALAFIALA